MTRMRIHQTGRRACLAAAIVVLAGTAAAQPIPSGRRVYDEQLRVRLDQQQAAARQCGLDGGGWFSFAFFNYDDVAPDKERTLRQYELRLWGSFTLEGVHNFYVRAVAGYDDWNSGDNPQTYRGDDFRGPRIERAWYKFDYNRLVRNRTGRDPDVGFVVDVGRDYHEIGTGLVLALPLDAVRVTGSLGNWQVGGLIAKTIESTPNIDSSDAVSTHMDRCFYAVQVRYKGFDRHEPFAYYLWQRDGTTPRPRDPLQRYDYDSNYLGIGSEGSLAFLPHLRYLAELVFESGQGFPEGVRTRQEEIHAMALDVLLEYLFDVKHHPKVAFEYLWGSGDSDRRLSSSATVGGNQYRTRDEAFNAFGFRDTGLAFAPQISNLHIFQLAVSAFPLEELELFRRMEIGSKAFFYTKDKRDGAISDVTATADSSWVGWEWDVFVNWRMTSDVSLTVRYGVFQPGAAFEDNDQWRHFLYAAVSYSF